MIYYVIIMMVLLLNDTQLSNNMDSTLESIVEAERAGANTTELVNRFNKVLSTVEDCQECIDTAKDMFIEIESEARDLKNKSLEEYKTNIILAYTVYAPIVAFIITLSSLYIYRVWQSYKIQRFQNMKVRKKDE